MIAAVEATALDASAGGTGGCTYTPKSTGNIATEDLVYLLRGMVHATDIETRRTARQGGAGTGAKAGNFEPVAG